jgi:hypothetical protein
LQKIIKKDLEFKWNKEEKESFEKIKIDISILHSPNFNHDLFLYTFASNHSLVAMFIQKDSEENKPLSLL